MGLYDDITAWLQAFDCTTLFDPISVKLVLWFRSHYKGKWGHGRGLRSQALGGMFDEIVQGGRRICFMRVTWL